MVGAFPTELVFSAPCKCPEESLPSNFLTSLPQEKVCAHVSIQRPIIQEVTLRLLTCIIGGTVELSYE